MKKSLIIFVISLFIFSTCSVLDSQEDNSKIAVGKYGIVSSAHPLASGAGIEMLKTGGNAFDAMIAVASVLNVVEPNMSGLGGYGTVLIYDARKDEVRFLNCSGKIPAAVDADLYRPPTPGYELNRRGAKAVSTPGNLNAWKLLHDQYGRVEWSELFQSAIKMAEKGVRVSPSLAGSISSAWDSFPEHARKIYGRNGSPLKSGKILIQSDLANTYKNISMNGVSGFYSGPLAGIINQAMVYAGGFLSIDDLMNDQARWWDPVSIIYRDHTVYTAGPPATAFSSLVRLGIMSQYNTQDMGHNSQEYLHVFAEVTKIAYENRIRFAGDPEVKGPPLDRLLSEEYWDAMSESIDPAIVNLYEYQGLEHEESMNTTHFVIADKYGNIVCATQTLGNSFGSMIMPEGTGIWLNNSLRYCTFEPAGNAMDAHAGRHKLSGDCPTIIFKGGKPVVAVGTPGGHTIGQNVPQIVMNIIDFGMSLYDAIDAPKICFVEPDQMHFESGIPDNIIEKLTGLGHNIADQSYGIGNAHGLVIEYDDTGKITGFTGVSDPRGNGSAAGCY